MIAILSHAHVTAVALLWAWLLTAAGDALLDRLRFGLTRPADRVGLGFAVGAGAVGHALLLLGAIGALRPVLLLAAAAAGALLLRERMREVARSIGHVGRAAWQVARERPEAGVALALLLVLLAMAYPLAVAPVTDWDSLAYHIPIAEAFLQEGRIFLPPDNLHVAHIGLVNLLYLVPLAAAPAAVTSVFGLIVAGVLVISAFDAGAKMVDERSGLLAAAATASTAMLVLVAVTPRIDGFLTLFLFLALRLVALDEVTDRRRVLLLGFLLGCAFATKVTAGLFGGVLLAVLLIAGHGRLRWRWGAAAGAALAAAVVGAPWLLKNAVLLNAPFYPFLAEPQPPPWLQDLPGGAEVLLERGTWNWSQDVRQPFNLRDFMLAPARLTVEPEAVNYVASPALALVPLVVLARVRALVVFAVVPLLYSLLLILGFPRLNLRYLLPAVVPLAVAGTLILAARLDRFRGPGAPPASRSRRGGWLLWTGLLCAVALPGTVAIADHLSQTRALSYFLGQADADTYREQNPNTRPLPAIERAARGVLPGDAHTIMLFEARTPHIPGTVYRDVPGTAWPYIVESGAAERCLEGAGATHLLVFDYALVFQRSRGLEAERMRWDALDTFARRCLTLVARTPHYRLFEITGSGSS